MFSLLMFVLQCLLHKAIEQLLRQISAWGVGHSSTRAIIWPLHSFRHLCSTPRCHASHVGPWLSQWWNTPGSLSELLLCENQVQHLGSALHLHRICPGIRCNPLEPWTLGLTRCRQPGRPGVGREAPVCATGRTGLVGMKWR